jgi:pimeloyl-ACP methyl ester carboxylesterase
MPKIKVRDITLAYEVWGQGTPVVYTPQGWFPRNVFSYIFAGRLSARYTVLLWDRRNSGASEIKIEDAPHENYLAVDDLHHLLNALNMTPAYLAGASNGCTFSLDMARRYPQDVKGLILIDPPSDDLTLLKPLIDARYFKLAEVAESEGMQSVIAHSTQAWVRFVSGASKPGEWDNVMNWVAECIQMNPSNRDHLLCTDPKQFSAAMRRWGQWTLTERFHLASLSDEELSRIIAPALVLHGFNALHPEHTARALATLLPNAELVHYLDRYTQEEILQVQGSDNYYSQNAFLKLPFIEAFLQRVESA